MEMLPKGVQRRLQLWECLLLTLFVFEGINDAMGRIWQKGKSASAN